MLEMDLKFERDEFLRLNRLRQERPKIDKIASPKIKVCSETLTLASSRKALFSSHTTGLQF